MFTRGSERDDFFFFLVCMPFLVLLWWKDYRVFWPQGQPSWGPWGALLTLLRWFWLATTCGWPRPSPTHTPCCDTWRPSGVEQPGRRRSQLHSVDAGRNLGNMGPVSPGKTRVIWPELPQWTPASKARFLGKNKKTRRVKITQNSSFFSFFSNSSLWWKREQFWYVWHLDWGVLGNYTAQTIVL